MSLPTAINGSAMIVRTSSSAMSVITMAASRVGVDHGAQDVPRIAAFGHLVQSPAHEGRVDVTGDEDT